MQHHIVTVDRSLCVVQLHFDPLRPKLFRIEDRAVPQRVKLRSLDNVMGTPAKDAASMGER